MANNLDPRMLLGLNEEEMQLEGLPQDFKFNPALLQGMVAGPQLSPGEQLVNIVKKKTSSQAPITITSPSKSIMPKGVWDELQQRQLQSFEAQKQGITDYEKEVGELKKNKMSPLVLALAGASDVLSDGNNLQKIMGTQAQQEESARQAGLNLQKMRQNLTDDEIKQLQAQYQHEQGLKEMQSDEDYKKQVLGLQRDKLTAGGKDLSPYQKAKQVSLGKSQAEFIDKDRGVLIANMDKVNNAIARLKSGEVQTGTVSKALFPNAAGYFDEAYAATKADINSAITDTLRPTLGAQFTEKEGERIKALSFDPAQGPEENARRAQALSDFIAKKVEFQDAFGAYLDENNGSDRGFPYEKYGMRKAGTSGTAPAVDTAKMKRLEELRKKAGK